MLFTKTIKTFSVVALFLGAFAPSTVKAATCSYASHHGIASYYGTPEDGYGYSSGKMTTSSGQRFIPSSFTAAHRSIPFGTRLRVTNQQNGKSVIVTINDRGPYAGNRVLDLSSGSFSKIANLGQGTVRVCFTKV